MTRLLQFPAAALVLALAAGPAAAASAPSRTFTVVSGEVRLRGDEQVCFRLSDDRVASDRVLVRVRFSGRVPDGRLELNGAVSERFSRMSEEVPFVIDPRGTHRLKLSLPAGTMVDQLSITSTESMIIQETCSTYEFEQARPRPIETPRDEPTNVFETPEERDERERAERDREDRDRANQPTGPTSPTGPTAPPPVRTGTASSAGGRVPAGTELSLTLQSGIDTRNAYAGQIFTAYLDHDVVVDGRVLLPEGSRIEGHVIESKDAGRFGRSSLKLGFDKALLPDGRTAALSASVSRVGKGSAKKQGGIIAGSAVGGAILGAILGGDDKDAILGAIVGGAIAAGSIGAKEGESIVLPAGTVVAINTDTSVEVPAKARR